MIGKKQSDRLRKRIDDNRAKRQAQIEKSRPFKERKREAEEAPPIIPRMDFWCQACGEWDREKGDIVAIARKQVVFPANDLPRARYSGECPKGHMVIRFITDKHRDPYYRQSIKMQRERARAADDLLQPNDPRFRIVYPEQYARMKALERAQEERKEIEEYNKNHGRK